MIIQSLLNIAQNIKMLFRATPGQAHGRTGTQHGSGIDETRSTKSVKATHSQTQQNEIQVSHTFDRPALGPTFLSLPGV